MHGIVQQCENTTLIPCTAKKVFADFKQKIKRDTLIICVY